jgi:hypothetical protein
MKFPVFWNRHNDDKTFEFQQSVVLSEQQADANAPIDPYEQIKQAQQEKLLLGDEVLTKYIIDHPEFHAFIPALSPVNRTTKHISKQDAKIMWIDYQILFCMEEMCMSPEKYEAGALEFLQGLEIHIGPIISDGFEGWKGNILTQQRKTIASEFKKVK